MLDLDSNAHSVFALHYHLIMTTKYRRRVFDDVISDRAKDIFILPDPITSLFKNGIMMSIIFISCSLLTLTLVLRNSSMRIRVPVHVY